MPSQFLTLVTALASAVVGGALTVVGVWLTNRSSTARLRLQLGHEVDQRKAQILRERGEELYVLVEGWLNGLAGYYLRKRLVMRGDLTYNESIDLGKADEKENPVNFGRLELLVNVYFPSASDAYKRTIHSRDAFDDIDTKYRQAYGAGDTDGTRFLEPFQKAIESIDTNGKALQSQILESIRAI